MNILSRLTAKFYRSRKNRNRIVISAVTLTTSMFTIIFVLGGSIVDSYEKDTMRIIGTSAHGGANNLTFDEFEKIKNHDDIVEYGTRVIIASAENEEFSKRDNVQVEYEDENYARWSFHNLSAGRMPERINEVVLDSRSLDLLGVPTVPGSIVPLRFSVDGKSYIGDYRLSGFFEDDRAAAYDIGYILMSRAFVDEYIASLPVDKLRKEQSPAPGSMAIMFNLSGSWNLESKIRTILDESLGTDRPHVNLDVNWAYLSSIFSDPDPTTVLLVSLVLMIVFFSAFLIIYNVYSLSLVNEIRSLGLMKTIGATSSQIYRIVMKQAWIHSFRGIPLGLILGSLSALIVLPLLESTIDGFTLSYSLGPVPLAVSVFFSLGTVLFSAFVPCRKASEASPMEALKYQNGSALNRKSRKGRKSRLHLMAWHNVFRIKSKIFFLSSSIALSFIVLLLAVSLVKGFSEEDYLRRVSPTDFTVGAGDFYSLNTHFAARPKPMDKILRELDKRFSLKNTEPIYYHMDELDDLTLQVYGVGSTGLRGLYNMGEVDRDKWLSGRYVITKGFRFKTGDKLTLATDKGEVELIVIAVSENRIADSIGAGYTIFPAETVYMPIPVYESLYDHKPIKMIFDSTAEERSEINQFLLSHTEQIDDDLDFTSRIEYEKEHNQFISLFTVLGGGLALLIGLIGIMNLINSIYTGIISRQREFAALESIGMTKKQQLKLVALEGFYYGLLSFLIIAVAGFPLVSFISRSLEIQSWFYSYYFPWPLLFMLFPTLPALTGLVPCIILKKSDRLSIVEKLKLTAY